MAVAASDEIVNWTSVEIQGQVDTVGEAIQAWLNDNPNVDISDLSATELDALIEYLKDFRGQAWVASSGLNGLIGSLSDLSGKLGSVEASTSADVLDTLRQQLELQVKVLDLLSAKTSGEDALDAAKTDLAGVHYELTDLIADLNGPMSEWSNNADTTVSEIQSLIDQLTALYDGRAMAEGSPLHSLLTNLDTRLGEYRAAIANGADPSLALSQLRVSFATDKITYFTAIGAPSSDNKVASAQETIDIEELWQFNLDYTWGVGEDWAYLGDLLNPAEGDSKLLISYSEEDLDVMLKQLESQRYQLDYLYQSGRISDQRYEGLIAGFEARTQLIRDTKASMAENNSEAISSILNLGDSLQLAIDFTVSDMGVKDILLGEISASNLPADQKTKITTQLEREKAEIQTFLDKLTDALSAVMDATSRLLGDVLSAKG